MIRNCTPQEAAAAMASGAKLVDVREPSEFLSVHVPGSVLVPLATLEAQLGALDAARPVCLLCGSGLRAAGAARALEAAGFQDLRVVEGGIEAWEKSGAPVRRAGPRVWSLDRQVRGTAGLIVAAGIALAWSVHPAWSLLSAFVGCGLVFSAVTGTCGLAIVLAKMPWNR